MAFDNFRFFHGLEANLPPATIDRLAEPAYTTDTNKLFICNGSSWQQFGVGGFTIPIAWTDVNKTGAVASDVGADPAGAAAAITLSGLGGVPSTRKITSTIDLSADRNLTYSDVGADPAGAAAAITLSGLGGVPTTRKINGYDLTVDRTLGYSDVGADAAGAAATVAGNLTTHANLTTAHGSTSLNTASAIVQRDASGNFAAGTITANLTGNVSGTAASFTGSLVGDVTGTQGATVVSTVGTSSAANVHAAELLANAATNANTASAIVRRDASGNFSAGTITANLTGNASGTAANVTGVVAVANGGTGLSTLTAGYIPFGNGTSALGSDAGLTWDNANKRLGVGAAPGNKLEVSGVASSPSLSAYSGNFAVTQSNLVTSLQMGGYGTDPYGVWLQATNNAGSSFPLLLNPIGGNVGIGTASPGARLAIGNPTYAPNANLVNNLLQLKSASGAAYLTIGNGNTTNSTAYIGGAGGALLFGEVTDAGVTTELMRVYNNVGIGTTGALAKLAVNGGVHVGGDSDPGDNNLLVDGTAAITGAFGCNGATPQTAYASGGAAGGTATSGGYGFVSSAEMNAFVTLVGNIRSALVANGVMS